MKKIPTRVSSCCYKDASTIIMLRLPPVSPLPLPVSGPSIPTITINSGTQHLLHTGADTGDTTAPVQCTIPERDYLIDLSCVHPVDTVLTIQDLDKIDIKAACTSQPPACTSNTKMDCRQLYAPLPPYVQELVTLFVNTCFKHETELTQADVVYQAFVFYSPLTTQLEQCVSRINPLYACVKQFPDRSVSQYTRHEVKECLSNLFLAYFRPSTSGHMVCPIDDVEVIGCDLTLSDLLLQPLLRPLLLLAVDKYIRDLPRPLHCIWSLIQPAGVEIYECDGQVYLRCLLWYDVEPQYIAAVTKDRVTVTKFWHMYPHQEHTLQCLHMLGVDNPEHIQIRTTLDWSKVQWPAPPSDVLSDSHSDE